MKANRKVEEPPGIQGGHGVAESVEGNEPAEDSDVLLARMYVRKNRFSKIQRKMLCQIEGEVELLALAKTLAELPEDDQRKHPSYHSLRTHSEIRLVRNYFWFVWSTKVWTEKFKGPNGERHRQDCQYALGLGEGI